MACERDEVNTCFICELVYCHVLKKDTKEIRNTKKSGVRGVPRQMLIIHGFRCGDPSMKEIGIQLWHVNAMK